MKKIIVVGIAALLAGAITATAILAAPPTLTQALCQSVRAASGNEIPDSELTVTVKSDRIKVQGQSRGSVNDPPSRIEWSIDLSTCTYQAKRFSGSGNGVPGSGSTINDKSNINQLNSNVADPDRNPELEVPDANFQVGFTLITKDPPPANFWLASTQNHLWWKSNAKGKVRWQRMGKGCTGWATPITHWFVVDCSFANPIYQNNRRQVLSNIWAKYRNFDFGDPNLSTDAEHFSEITGFNNNTFLHTWSFTHSGEFFWLLRGEIVRDF